MMHPHCHRLITVVTVVTVIIGNSVQVHLGRQNISMWGNTPRETGLSGTANYDYIISAHVSLFGVLCELAFFSVSYS